MRDAFQNNFQNWPLFSSDPETSLYKKSPYFSEESLEIQRELHQYAENFFREIPSSSAEKVAPRERKRELTESENFLKFILRDTFIDPITLRMHAQEKPTLNITGSLNELTDNMSLELNPNLYGSISMERDAHRQNISRYLKLHPFRSEMTKEQEIQIDYEHSIERGVDLLYYEARNPEKFTLYHGTEGLNLFISMYHREVSYLRQSRRYDYEPPKAVY